MSMLNYVNDFKEPRRQAKSMLAESLEGRGEYSFSYIALLLSATVVCTLGLITNSTAVIIGGMIIAPLMWPILKVSFGIAVKRTKVSFRPFLIFIVSTLVIFFGAALVAFLSPIKDISPEMLARASPTTLEIFIALAAAVIAALATTHPKITDSVAGVAVATSLVPPLCVSGIGLAYFNSELAVGGLILYLTNAATIMLVATIIFTLFIFGKDLSSLKNRSVFMIVLVLALVSLPLYSQLNRSIASSSINANSRTILEEEIAEILPNARIEDFSTSLFEGNKVAIRSTILLPPSRSITYEQEQGIIEELERKLAKEVDLQLVLQESLEPITEEEIAQTQDRRKIESLLGDYLLEVDYSLQINTVSTKLSEDSSWDVAVSVRASDSSIIGVVEVDNIEQQISEQVGSDVNLTVEVINSKIVGAEQAQLEQDRVIVTDRIIEYIPRAKVLELQVQRQTGSNSPLLIEATILIPANLEFEDEITRLKSSLERSFSRSVTFNPTFLKFTTR